MYKGQKISLRYTTAAGPSGCPWPAAPHLNYCTFWGAPAHERYVNNLHDAGLSADDSIRVTEIILSQSVRSASFGTSRLIEYASARVEMGRCVSQADDHLIVYRVEWSAGFLGEDGDADFGARVFRTESDARTYAVQRIKALGLD